jgi:hypothetical protein
MRAVSARTTPFACVGAASGASFLTAASLPATTYYVTVTGLGGEPDYEQHFAMWAKDIEKALKTSPDSKVETLVNATREQVRAALDGIAQASQAAGRLRAHAHRPWQLRWL